MTLRTLFLILSLRVVAVILVSVPQDHLAYVPPLAGLNAEDVHSGVGADIDPYPALGKPRITLKRLPGHPDHNTSLLYSFKLTVFSDLHFGENEEGEWGPEQDANSTRLMKRVLKEEKPDYVVLNGDLITGENTFKENSTLYIKQIVGPLNSARIPFSSTHGNHDNQVNITHLQEILYEQELSPLSYTRIADSLVGGSQGQGNYWVPVYRNNHDKAPVLVLWFFDSRGGVYPNPTHSPESSPTLPLPDWVDASVAEWIKYEVAKMEQAWGSGAGRGALAFMHIPPYAIKAVQETLHSENNPGQNADYLGQGSVQASMDPSSKGNDEVFWSTLNRQVQNLFAVVSGHDHGNEWCAREPTQNVVFCFDKHSGYGGYSDDGWGHGVRNFLLTYRPGSPSASPGLSKPTVETWIRLEEGEERARVVLNGSYGRLS